MMRRVLLSLFVLFGLAAGNGLSANELVCLQTDRSLYAAGETVWMRGWIDDPTEMPASKYLYVELLRDGAGTVEQRIKLKERGGLFLGQLPLSEDLESGWYTLRAYTRAQKDWPGEALFHARLLIRGAGPVPLLHRAEADEAVSDGIRVAVDRDGEERLTVRLSDAEGNPVVGNFALSIVQGRYADFDHYSAPSRPVSDTLLPEGPREYAQELDFRVRSSRSRLPEKYDITVMAQDIGYYFSVGQDGGQNIKGSEGQSFRIPDLDFPEGTLFTVHVSGSPAVFPTAEEESFARPFDYGPTYSVREEIRDTAVVRRMLEDIAASVPAGDTLSVSVITAGRKQARYRPERTVGPYSSVFDWRQVKLREELHPYDDMDLMMYISSTWTGLFCTVVENGVGAGRTMYTTRGGSVSSRVVASHGEVAQYSTTASYHPVELYMNGVKMDDWSEASPLTVRDVQNIYVLRGSEAALYKASAVVLLETRRFDEKDLRRPDARRQTVGLLPLGWQRPKSFVRRSDLAPERAVTLYWNPCIRTDASGRADIDVPALPADGASLRIAGRTSDGRWIFGKVRLAADRSER